MCVAGQSQFRKHRSPRILPNQVWETPSIPVRRVRKDVLFDERHALLPSPTSKSYFRRGHRSQSRGCQHFLDSRIEGIAWNTVARWLEKAAQVCRRFNHTRIAGFAAEELQADEIRTFAGNKKTPSWVFVTIEVWSRLWPSTVTGRRSYRNTYALFHDLSRRMNFERLPLIVTDGFEFYQKVIRRFFGQRVFTAKSSKLAGMIVSSRSNGERCTEPRGDSKTRSITPRTPRH